MEMEIQFTGEPEGVAAAKRVLAERAARREAAELEKCMKPGTTAKKRRGP